MISSVLNCPRTLLYLATPLKFFVRSYIALVLGVSFVKFFLANAADGVSREPYVYVFSRFVVD